ncbi:MAG TPA: acyl-CoA dehydrogenase family protein [Anaeromyxobacteraceae bacterium]|nr:acyl-CoA dehydrogenase family protein [Anaeromyxobacteraceae bacterium]
MRSKPFVVPQASLERFWERAPGHDRDGTFFLQDFRDLQEGGYLRLAVPEALGGLGRTLADVAREQRRLAYYSAPTALAVNMHLYWTGLAADLWRAGDRSLEWLLRGAARGEVYAAGHGETGNDVPVLLSTTRATRVEGGYRFTGRKSFGSLAPVWTYLGMHGMDASDPAAPRIVHAFMHRGAKGSTPEETWDVLGMRATRSDDTVLEEVFVPDERVARVVPAGGAGLDAFVLGLFAWALVGFGNVYYGLARRVFDLTVARVKEKRSLALSRSMAHHPEVQHAVAEMALELEAVEPHLDRIAEDWSSGVDHGASWPARLFAAKHHAVEASWRVVDTALDVAGGFGVFRRGGLERLFRDARLGRIHPANAFLTREVVAKTALGIGLDQVPRWG